MEYAVVMHVGEHIEAALKRHGIAPEAVAERLGVTRNAVYNIRLSERPNLRTLERYATAMTAVLHERGDPRRFTAESLQRGPDPEPAAPAPDPAPASLADILARLAQALPPPPEDSPLESEELEVQVWDGGHCGVSTEASRPVGRMRIPLYVAGAGANAETCHVVIARGESMTGDGIEDGDELVVRTDLAPEPGDVVLVDGMVRRVDASGQRLVSLQRGHRIVTVDVGDLETVQPQGVVVYSLRPFRRGRRP